MKVLNVLVVALIAAGIALAVTGKSTLKWAPPPLPQKWEAPAAQLAGHRPPGERARGLAAAGARRPPGQHAPGQHAPGHHGPGASAGQPGRARRGQYRAPASTASPARPTPATAARAGSASAATGQPPAPAAAPMARSLPVSVAIPAIGVRAEMIRLGLEPGGAMAVPPLTHPQLAGWFDLGPTPGERGTAVIVGHVDAAGVGPAVFYELGDLRPGDRIYVTLADHRVAAFAVWAAALYPKADFPAATVYGDTSQPSLRLITCGGIFDPQTGHYLSNIVVFATYLGPV
jgi:hypothetical protein